MKQKKYTKRALCMSVLSLLLCCSMLVGTTFAWFTDSVTSGKNRIVAGNLDVDLLMDKGDDAGYVSIADGEGDIFSESGNGINWEPGKTEIVYLAVRNMGTLALKYNIMLNIIDGGLLKKSDDGTLETSLEYAILDGVKRGELNDVTSWDELCERTGVQTGDLLAGTHRAAKNGCLDEVYNSKEENETDYFALAVHMKEDAGNEYQEGSATIDLTVIAGQAQAETDSFGNDYDADAKYADYVVDSPEGLKQALTEINENDEVDKGVIKAGSDFTYEDESLEVDSGKDIVIDLDGHTLTIKNGTCDGLVVSGGGTLTLTNSESGGSYKFTSTSPSYNSIYVENTEAGETTLNLEDVNIEIENTSSKQISIHAYAKEGKSVINFGEGTVVTMTGTQHFAGVQLSKNGEMNMTGGVINVDCETEDQDPSGVVLDGEGAVLNMSGGQINVNGTGSILGVEIGNGNGTFNMTGGEINVDSAGPEATAVGMSFSGTLNLSGGTLNVAATAGNGYGIGILSASYLGNMEVHLSGDFAINVDVSAKGENVAIAEAVQDLIDDPDNEKFTDDRVSP